MKKIVILLLLLPNVWLLAQNRVMQVHRGGNIEYSIDVLDVDSILLKNKTLQIYNGNAFVQSLQVSKIG